MHKRNPDERSFDFFVKKKKHYVFSLSYKSGQGWGGSSGVLCSPEELLANGLVGLEVKREYGHIKNNKPIKVKFHGKIFNRHSTRLEYLLKIYARSEGVPIGFEYLPAVRR